MITVATLTAAVKARALALGFDAVAVGAADPPAHGDELRRWVEAGRAGTMAYLERRLEERLDPRRVLPGARSVVCVALNYHQGRIADGSWAPVARYAWGRDYHEVMLPRLQALAALLREAASAESRAYVDTGPVLERELAARAGLGWVGKNTMLLSPSLGSWFFIGVLLTTAELVHDPPLPDRCGSCRACLDACPTGAFAAPRLLDARRCISYLTIEHRGPIEPALAAGMGQWQFGCDLCQSVCPWNRKAPVTREEAFRPAAPYPGAEALLQMDDAALRRRFAGTALLRPRAAGLRRNAAIALRNRQSNRKELTPMVDPARDALVIVDVQNDFCPGGTLAVPHGDGVVEPLNRYAAHVAGAGAAVFASRDWHPARTRHFKAFGGVWPAHCVQGTGGAEFHPALRLPAGTTVISKGMDPDEDAYSCFQGQAPDSRPFAGILAARGIKRLFVGGLATDYCVKATALDALREGFEVVVLEDAIRAVDIQPGDGARALEELKRAGATFAGAEPL
ncbi:MAG: tRNA epoxyqueuosine(34) reductase QueG [Candidatus Rokubacteria bacterium]|nr:tRNA epoxyqueuosine(34) reductase QueG [Candidatus Rokubacteria bacterium]